MTECKERVKLVSVAKRGLSMMAEDNFQWVFPITKTEHKVKLGVRWLIFFFALFGGCIYFIFISLHFGLKTIFVWGEVNGETILQTLKCDENLPV